MPFTIDRNRRPAGAIILALFLLLNPWEASAESLSSPQEARTANSPGDNSSGETHGASPSGDLSHPPAQESQLDRLRDRAIEQSLVESHPSASVLSPFQRPLQSSLPARTSDPNPNPSKGLSIAIKEAVRPTYNEAVNSSVVDAIRSVTGAKADHEGRFAGDNPEKESERDPQHLATERRTWDGPNESTQAPTLSPEQKAANQVKAGVLLTALIDEITPWAMGIVGLYGLYHLGKFGRAYLRRKLGRRRSRRRHGTISGRGDQSSSDRSQKRRHRSRSTRHRPPAELERTNKSTVNSPPP